MCQEEDLARQGHSIIGVAVDDLPTTAKCHYCNRVYEFKRSSHKRMMRYTSEEDVLALKRELDRLATQPDSAEVDIKVAEAYNNASHLIAVMLRFTIEVDIEVV
jgi:hypothetical protein